MHMLLMIQLIIKMIWVNLKANWVFTDGAFLFVHEDVPMLEGV